MSLTFPGPLTTAMHEAHGHRAATVAGGMGVVPAAPIDTQRHDPAPAPKMSAKDAERLMTAELLSAMRALVESSTELSSTIGRRGATNGVLDVFLDTIGANGYIQRDYPVTVGSVGVINHHATLPVIVQSGQPNGTSAPATGRGVQRIEPGSYLVMPIGERAFTIWGTATTILSVQAFTGLQPWGAGVL
jgi:hypothetical protein